MDLGQIKTLQNKEKNRFELIIEGQVAFIDYILNTKGEIFLTHTEVPKALEGKGIASKMTKEVFEWIEENDLKLFPLCPYIIAFMRKHPEYKSMLALGVNI